MYVCMYAHIHTYLNTCARACAFVHTQVHTYTKGTKGTLREANRFEGFIESKCCKHATWSMCACVRTHMSMSICAHTSFCVCIHRPLKHEKL